MHKLDPRFLDNKVLDFIRFNEEAAIKALALKQELADTVMKFIEFYGKDIEGCVEKGEVKKTPEISEEVLIILSNILRLVPKSQDSLFENSQNFLHVVAQYSLINKKGGVELFNAVFKAAPKLLFQLDDSGKNPLHMVDSECAIKIISQLDIIQITKLLFSTDPEVEDVVIRGLLEKGIATLEEEIIEDPTNPELNRALAKMLFAVGKTSEAIKCKASNLI